MIHFFCMHAVCSSCYHKVRLLLKLTKAIALSRLPVQRLLLLLGLCIFIPVIILRTLGAFAGNYVGSCQNYDLGYPKRDQ